MKARRPICPAAARQGAAETLLTCYATGKPLRIVPDDIAALTAQQWRDYGQLAIDHLLSENCAHRQCARGGSWHILQALH
ncbi:MAG TPA: hypothetical protein VGL34_16175 [Steroidobacteraceae bacterium]|jgi:hypothetical protein